MEFRVLIIDAWVDSDGWTWNNWHPLLLPYDTAIQGELTPQTAMEFFKVLLSRDDEIFLKSYEIEDDSHNLVLREKGTLKPIYAIEYGGIL